MGWGFLIGASIGGLMGAADYASDPDAMFAGIAMVAGPIVGGLIGLLIGPWGTYDLFELDIHSCDSAFSGSRGSSGIEADE